MLVLSAGVWTFYTEHKHTFVTSTECYDLPGVEFVLLGFDVGLARVSVVYQLPGDLIDNGHAWGLVIHFRLQTLKPGG